MSIAITVVLILASLCLIGSILLQAGTSAGLSGSIAGGAEQLFGRQKGRGYESILEKATMISAVLFIVCSLLLVYLGK